MALNFDIWMELYFLHMHPSFARRYDNLLSEVGQKHFVVVPDFFNSTCIIQFHFFSFLLFPFTLQAFERIDCGLHILRGFPLPLCIV